MAKKLDTSKLVVSPDFVLADFDRASTPGFTGNEKDGVNLLKKTGDDLDELQEKLFAHGRTGGGERVLLILQGMDTAGKGGIVRHVVGLVDPQGVSITSFKSPTPEELSHHYLWRIEKELPAAGEIGVFDRSHYEDVLIARVRSLVPQEVWEPRYDEINAWEARLVDSGCHLIKCALLVSPEEQLRRLQSRLERSDKYWKYSPNDLNEREYWGDYQTAYQAMFERTSTEHAPWHAIPADNKWFARLAISRLLVEKLESLNLDWPEPTFDLAEEQARIAALLA